MKEKKIQKSRDIAPFKHKVHAQYAFARPISYNLEAYYPTYTVKKIL